MGIGKRAAVVIVKKRLPPCPSPPIAVAAVDEPAERRITIVTITYK